MSVDANDAGAPEAGGLRRRRRSWSEAEKRRIVAESYEPGNSVSLVARRHDVNANQVFTWRRQQGLMAHAARRLDKRWEARSWAPGTTWPC